MLDMATAWREHDKWTLFLGALIACGMVLVGVGLAFGVYQVVFNEDPWDPLGEYPIQTVNSRVPGVEGPAARLGERVAIEGTKCNTTDDTVRTTGRSSWVPVGARELAILAVEATNTLEPGCTTRKFRNPIPDAVAELVLSDGLTRWYLTGTETPVDGLGRTGVEVVWQTETFTLAISDD